MPEQLTLFAEDGRAKTSAPPIAEVVRDWAESEAAFGTRCVELSATFAHAGWSERMSPVCYHTTEDVISESSYGGWQTSGIVSHTGCLTLSSSEFPSAAVVSSLSQVLETQPAEKYSLSREACLGILRRAEERGRDIPHPLKEALESITSAPSP